MAGRCVRWSLFGVLFLVPSTAEAVQQREPVATLPKFDLTPFGNGVNMPRAELVPVLAGELVLVTSSLRLFAFDASTAELRWSAGPPPGWDALEPAARARLFDGLGRRLWIAPAAGERVAIAALQVPMSKSPGEEWQGIRIATQLPERRLFAYELGTGRPLWNHAPPPDWDGKSGPHEQRMTLIGSPTVVGDRVIVACTSDTSSIDYNVSCYQLATGALSWSTFVVRGQVERNSNGRLIFEFTGAPLVAVPGQGRLLAQTGLGQIAALDLATGAILWRTEYYPIELPKTRSYTPPRREVVWRTTPPIVVGDVVLATPPDSRDLLALDLEDGHRLWIIPMKGLSELDRSTELLSFDHLVGADAEVLFLGGAKVSAFSLPRGLRSPHASRPVPLWTVRVERPDTSGRAHLFGDQIFQPNGPIECLALDQASGKSRGSHEVNAMHGMLVTDGAVFAVTENGLERVER